MGVEPKIGYPQIIHFNRVFHFKPSILGGFPTPIFGNTHVVKLFGLVVWLYSEQPPHCKDFWELVEDFASSLRYEDGKCSSPSTKQKKQKSAGNLRPNSVKD